MVSKLTPAVVFLGVTLFSLPVYAEFDPSPPQTAVQDPGPLTKLDLKLSDIESSDFDKLDLKYAKTVAVDTGRVLVSPLNWEKKEWLTFGLLVGGTGTLFLGDKEVNEFAKKNHSSVASKFADLGNFAGTPQYIFPSVGAFYLYGYLADDRKARRASLLALESMTISGVLTMGVKYLVQRQRPDTTDDPYRFHGPTWGQKHVSFSSGHTAFAFSAATIFAEEYKDNAYVPPIAYGLATLTGLARVYSTEHWSSDVFFGAALGYLVSKTVLSYHPKDKGKENRLTIVPVIGEKMTGLSVKYDF